MKMLMEKEGKCVCDWDREGEKDEEIEEASEYVKSIS